MRYQPVQEQQRLPANSQKPGSSQPRSRGSTALRTLGFQTSASRTKTINICGSGPFMTAALKTETPAQHSIRPILFHLRSKLYRDQPTWLAQDQEVLRTQDFQG